MTADSLGARESDVILPVVPMFHANAWGLAHAGGGRRARTW
jgi:fatty-acyl-CoA synthase